MGSMRNPAPGNPTYQHGAKPGSPGSVAGMPRHDTIGGHPANNPGKIAPQAESPIQADMSPIMDAGIEHGATKGGPAPLNADSNGGGMKPSPRHAGRGNP